MGELLKKSARWGIYAGLLLLLAPFRPAAQEWRLSDVQPYRSGDSLTLRFSSSHLLRSDIRKSLLAGLPLIMEIHISLTRGQQPVATVRRTYRIRYNVWEESFTLWAPGGPRRFTTLPALETALSRFDGLLRAPLKSLPPDGEYRFWIEARLALLTRRQSRVLEDWMEKGAPLEEELPSQERSTGFKLNLNRLIQMFMGSKEKQPEYRTEAVSAPFRPEQLPTR